MAGEDRGNDRSGRAGSGEEPEERTDLWMTTYADMVSLLMTFFLLLFAISNVDSQKAALLFAGLSRDGLTAEQWLEIMEPDVSPPDDADADLFPTPSESSATASPEPSEPGVPVGNPELEALANMIGQYIDDHGWGDRMSLMFDGEYLLLTLVNDIWFASGSADITPRMRESAADLAKLLAETYNDDNPFEIVVSGHTDNVPINTVRFPSNWHVSMARATNFLEILVVDSGIDPGHFSAVGCGEFRPIASNDTPEGRQANRRVEVQIGMERLSSQSALMRTQVPLPQPSSSPAGS